jgi:hypothetical protein
MIFVITEFQTVITKLTFSPNSGLLPPKDGNESVTQGKNRLLRVKTDRPSRQVAGPAKPGPSRG